MSLSALNNKKAKNTLQDERYQLNVTVPAPDLQKVNAYLGCSHCGKRTDYATGEKFKCETCTKDDVVSEPRITFNCEVSDGTERLEITAFTSDTSDMFQMSAADIFHMKHSGDNTSFGKVCDALNNGPLVIEVSPKIALSRNNILQWALRRIVAAPSRDVATYKLPPVDTQEQSTAQETDQEPAVANTKQPAPVARQLHFGEEEQTSNTFTLVDVAVSSDYPSLRKLPASIIPALPENIQLHSTVAEGPTAPTQLDITAATETTPTSATTAITSKIINLPTTPVLKAPKVEKAAACTPETPLQNTPKHNSAKQCTGSPSKKKKAACSSTAGQ
ncbi:uncharacterized protein LOC141634534 [Silene latifolia]|uniref:uncharacterized protein LOC141634534 n=1 Tax=Silene latifolia TaxID=37657 RepID=UPI003D78698C